MPICRRVSVVLAKGTCGRSDFDLDLGRVAATGRVAAGYGEEWGLAFPLFVVKKGSNIRLSQVRSQILSERKSPSQWCWLNLCAAPIANVA